MEAILNVLKPIIESFMNAYPALSIVLVVIGSARTVMKPLMSLVQAVVEMTPTQIDNEFILKLMDSKVYKAVAYVLDWSLSVKLPKK